MDDFRYQVDLLTAMNQKLLKEEEMYKMISEILSDAYIYRNFIDGRIIASLQYYQLFDLNSETIRNQAIFYEHIFEEDRGKFKEAEQNAKLGESRQEFEVRMADGRRWLSVTIFTKYDEQKNMIQQIHCYRDITKLKSKNEELEYLAFYDSLTGLYNRNYFIKRLDDAITEIKGTGTIISVMYMDVDDFKKINDVYGILIGDELILNFGQLVHDFMGSNVFAARLSHDSFCMAIIDPIGNRSVDYIYKELVERLKKPFLLSNRKKLSLSVSVGVAEYPESGESAVDLVRNAEIVMFDVKSSGKNGLRYFNKSILNKFIEDVRLERHLKKAIENKEFVLFYQPQFDVKTKEPRGTEALIRWYKDGSFINPLKFIPLAEKTGSIVEIGNWVMEEAIKTYAEWCSKYQYKGIMSINISAIQMRHDSFVPNLLSLIEHYQVDPLAIELEITESILIENFHDVVEKIKVIRDYGIKVSLDDFGTGYSSLSYLKDIPIDTLKIDKTFVDNAISDNCTGIITESVVEMVKKLGLETVAEGVETDEQFNYLKAIHCDNIQGYLLGKPMPRAAFESLIKEKSDGK